MLVFSVCIYSIGRRIPLQVWYDMICALLSASSLLLLNKRFTYLLCEYSLPIIGDTACAQAANPPPPKRSARSLSHTSLIPSRVCLHGGGPSEDQRSFIYDLCVVPTIRHQVGLITSILVPSQV